MNFWPAQTHNGLDVYDVEFSESEIDAICHDEQMQEDAAEVFDTLQNEIDAYGAVVRHRLAVPKGLRR